MLARRSAVNIRRLSSVFRHLGGFKRRSSFATAASFIGMAENENGKPTAGIIIIGDEILKGFTQDTNSHFICTELYKIGVKVERISVIGDDLLTISDEVSTFSKKYTHVITSGGIGPTHDDVTFAGVANAFGETVKPHPELVKICQDYFGASNSLDSPQMKMAHVPESARLIYGHNPKSGKRHLYPLICVGNVYIFPGIPKQLKAAFLSLKEHLFQGSKVHFHLREIFLNTHELAIASYLNQFNVKYRDTVQLGSYPKLGHSYYSVKLTLESNSESLLQEAYQELLTILPDKFVVNYEKDPIGRAPDAVYELISPASAATAADVTQASSSTAGASSESSETRSSFALPGSLDVSKERLGQSVGAAVQIMEEMLERYKLEEICAGFNGGKDCTALIHLFHAVVRRKYPEFKGQLQAMFIEHPHGTFPEVEEFIQESLKRYNLKPIVIKGRIKQALGEMKTSHPDIKAVLMGTRQTDPYSETLSAFSPTDKDWPEYMRVNPMLTWSYHDVWAFLRSLYVPYCRLYDKGYTSLGGVATTSPNPALMYTNNRGELSYYPAYMLQDEAHERSGRNPLSPK